VDASEPCAAADSGPSEDERGSGPLDGLGPEAAASEEGDGTGMGAPDPPDGALVALSSGAAAPAGGVDGGGCTGGGAFGGASPGVEGAGSV
jgi:hypothetical protein